jgi:HEAT repeat protein
LQSDAPGVRLRAIQLGLHSNVDQVETVAGLLNDPAVEVRRAALVAVGPADQVLDETLLPCLRDPDAEVRSLCEKALKGRGLSRQHIELARLLTAPEAAQRLQVLDHLGRADLEPGVWLRRLSHDPAPSVRAAAVRVMGQLTEVNLTDRLSQMAQADPSSTVSYLAAVYLKQVRELQAEPTP